MGAGKFTIETDRVVTHPITKGIFRYAVISDARNMQKLIQLYADQGKMLPRSLNELFESIRQYVVYEEDGKLLGICGLHISWEDLAEIRALAVYPTKHGENIGTTLVNFALQEARRLKILKVFTLTYEPEFFIKLGFVKVDKAMFPHKIWRECIKCHKFPDCDETALMIETP
ncbi:MAG: N-acetyltransferase [Nitrospinota bacterium]